VLALGLSDRQFVLELWSNPDTRMGFALDGAADYPNRSLWVIEQRSDIPARTRRILALYVNAHAAKRTREPFTTRAIELCQELKWSVCDPTMVKDIAEMP
jgi:hypothetical protein